MNKNAKLEFKILKISKEPPKNIYMEQRAISNCVIKYFTFIQRLRLNYFNFNITNEKNNVFNHTYIKINVCLKSV